MRDELINNIKNLFYKIYQSLPEIEHDIVQPNCCTQGDDKIKYRVLREQFLQDIKKYIGEDCVQKFQNVLHTKLNKHQKTIDYNKLFENCLNAELVHMKELSFQLLLETLRNFTEELTPYRKKINLFVIQKHWRKLQMKKTFLLKHFARCMTPSLRDIDNNNNFKHLIPLEVRGSYNGVSFIDENFLHYKNEKGLIDIKRKLGEAIGKMNKCSDQIREKHNDLPKGFDDIFKHSPGYIVQSRVGDHQALLRDRMRTDGAGSYFKSLQSQSSATKAETTTAIATSHSEDLRNKLDRKRTRCTTEESQKVSEDLRNKLDRKRTRCTTEESQKVPTDLREVIKEKRARLSTSLQEVV